MVKKYMKGTILFIRKYGNPTEEAILIPIISLIGMMHMVDIGRVEAWLAAYVVLFIWLLSGFWLGISLNKIYPIRIMLRVWAMAIFSVAGYAAVRETPYPRQVYMNDLGKIASNLGLWFYLGYIIGFFVSDLLLFNLTEKQKLIALKRKSNLKRFFLNRRKNVKVIFADMLSIKEEEWKWEILLSRILKNCWKPTLIILIIYLTSKGSNGIFNESLNYLGIHKMN